MKRNTVDSVFHRPVKEGFPLIPSAMKSGRGMFSTFKNLAPLRPYFARNKWKLFAGLICLLTVDILQLFIPRIIKKAVDDLTLLQATQKALMLYALVIVVIALVLGVLRFLWRRLIFGHSRIVERDLREKVFSHLQTLSLNFYAQTRTGDLMARSVNDMDAIRFAVGMGVVAFNDGVVLGLAAIGFMLYINIELTLIALLPMPAIVLASRVLTRRMHTLFQQVQHTFGELTELTREAFVGIRIVQAYRRENWETRRMKSVGEKYIDQNIQLGRTMAFFFPMMLLFTNVSLAIVLWSGGGMTILNRISTGDFVAFITYLNLLTWPMMALGWVTNLIQRGSASMKRINRLLDQAPEIADSPNPVTPTEIRGAVELRNVTFRYPNDGRNVLENLTLKLEAGTTAALVGRTGCGKTTLVRMLARMVEADSGQVYLDGIPIQKLPLHIVRAAFTVVPQETHLFSDTIYNNLVFREGEVDSKRLQECLDASDLTRDVNDFPDGLDTLVGEKGLSLSGGQRQRLALARALLTNPAILVVDNALSMVDAATERRILDHLVDLRASRTTLWISHRISTIRRAERILVLDQGRIAESGDHEELLGTGNIYPRLYFRSLLQERLEN